MRMSEEEKQIILKKGQFLLDIGYEADMSGDYGVDFNNGEFMIMAYYERYERQSGLDIKFAGNYHYSIGWIATVRGDYCTRDASLLEHILYLMDYLERNYDKITDKQYCEESRGMIDDYIAAKRKENPALFQ